MLVHWFTHTRVSHRARWSLAAMEAHDRHAFSNVSCTASSASPSSLRMENASVNSRFVSADTTASNATSGRLSLDVIRSAEPITPLLTLPEAILLTRDMRTLGGRRERRRARCRHTHLADRAEPDEAVVPQMRELAGWQLLYRSTGTTRPRTQRRHRRGQPGPSLYNPSRAREPEGPGATFRTGPRGGSTASESRALETRPLASDRPRDREAMPDRIARHRLL